MPPPSQETDLQHLASVLVAVDVALEDGDPDLARDLLHAAHLWVEKLQRANAVQTAQFCAEERDSHA